MKTAFAKGNARFFKGLKLREIVGVKYLVDLEYLYQLQAGNADKAP